MASNKINNTTKKIAATIICFALFSTAALAGVKAEASNIKGFNAELTAGEDMIFDTADAQWTVNGKKVNALNGTVSTGNGGAFAITKNSRVSGKDVVESDMVLVGEELLSANAIDELEGDSLTVDGRNVAARKIADAAVNATVLRVRGQLFPGTRVVYNKNSAGNYQFVELKENADLSGWVLVVGSVRNGQEKVRKSHNLAAIQGDAELKVAVDTASAKVSVELDGAKIFGGKFRGDISGGLSLVAHSLADYDVLLSQETL